MLASLNNSPLLILTQAKSKIHCHKIPSFNIDIYGFDIVDKIIDILYIPQNSAVIMPQVTPHSMSHQQTVVAITRFPFLKPLNVNTD